MFCPTCQNSLRERQRGDVMLDICPGCGGIWLDRGELEKLTTSERSYYRRDDDDDDDDWDRGQRYEMRPDDGRISDSAPPRRDSNAQHRRKRGGFLENLFGNFGEGGAADD